RQPASSVLRGFQPALLLFHAPDFGLGLADRAGNLTRMATWWALLRLTAMLLRQSRIRATAPDRGMDGSSLTAPFRSDSAIMRTTSALIGSIDLMDVMTACGSAGTETVLSS